MFRPKSKTLVAILLSLIAAVSAAQMTTIAPRPVSADSTLTFQLTFAPTNTEPASANGSVEVDTQTGHVKVDLKQATPSTPYVVIFVSTATSTQTQLGTMMTNGGGEGSLEASLAAGTYVGLFQILKANVIQYLTVETSFNIGATATASVTSTTSENSTSTLTSTTETSSTLATSTQTSSQTTAQASVSLEVHPSLRSISAGAFAKFEIGIKSPTYANVLLTARSVPPNSVAIFTQNLGVANSDFQSTLTIVTSADTPAGTYGVTLIALINGVEYTSQIGLEVTASTSGTPTATISAGTSLTITISTAERSYNANATVNLQGHVTDNTGSAVADATVSVQVDGPTGVEISMLDNLRTDTAGVFHASVNLASAPAGTYTAFATAAKAGYTSATTHTTFVVGTSTTPSVVIQEVYVTDISGTRTTTFSAGQTVLVWVEIENSGATFQGVIWVQIRDPNGTPIWIQFQISQLGTGQTVKIAFGFTITGNLRAGLYTANALVSDKLISQGGAFLASANIDFALTA